MGSSFFGFFLAFILGVLPLVIAKGAGAEMRQSLGTAVFSGMLGVTFFGLFLTPVFYVVIRRVIERRKENAKVVEALANGAKTIAVIVIVFGLLSGCMVDPINGSLKQIYRLPLPIRTNPGRRVKRPGFSGARLQ